MNPKQWLDIGIAVIPCRYRSKRPVFAWRKYQAELPTEDDLKEWFKSRFVNVAIITGWQGLTICDFDDWQTWQVWENWITIKYPNLLNTTYQVKTSRGMHVYFLIENPPERTMKLPKIDVKAAGGYCLIPNSIHPSGHQYRAISNDLQLARIERIEDVIPGMLLSNAVQDVIIPPCPVSHNRPVDIWNIAPESNNDRIDWIKSNRNILEFFPNAIPSGGNGRWYKVICPLHNDHAESGWIDTERNRFGCQACLNKSLDVIDLFGLLRGVDRKTAIYELSR